MHKWLEVKWRTCLRKRPLTSAGVLGSLWAASLVFSCAAPAAEAQGKTPAAGDLTIPPVRWAEVAAATEEHVVNYDTDAPLRYRVRTVNAKGENTREVIESKEGSVARLLERNGQPLTTEEDTDERKRLQDILDSPDAFLRHMRHEAGSRTYASELLHSMPRAMIWSYTPGQPQLGPGSPSAIVLDFKPDPAFKPPTLVTEALTGISGKVWVDPASHCVLRIQGQILHPVNFGWGGVLARIKEGGYVQLEQRQASDRRWLYSHLVERISIREILVHTTDENAEVTASNVQALPGPISFREAVKMLLAIPVPTRQP